MTEQTYLFSHKKVDYFLDGSFKEMLKLYDAEKIVIITDERVNSYHHDLFAGYKTIVIKGGEQNKNQQNIDGIIAELLRAEADKGTVIVGVGGGVVTDMAGYTASIFKRGVRLVQVPTSILGMVDAAVGGKNGVDVGMYKNMVGTIYQPEIILFDFDFLKTLPHEEWVNGFAEIIKHACIKDEALFTFLQQHQLQDFIDDRTLIADLVQKNVEIKTTVVTEDEFETGDRKLLNFGHTLGHAVENIYELPHGHAISVGMVAACFISEEINMFSSAERQQVIDLLQQYSLTVKLEFDKDKVWEVLLMDKKRDKNGMNFILLNKIGEGIIQSIPMGQLKSLIDQSI